jgi:hypothetical protein
MMDDRSEPRIRTFEEARIACDCEERFARGCVLADLSGRGARLRLVGAGALPDEIELFLPRQQLWTRARVIWRRPSACGVEFLRG